MFFVDYNSGYLTITLHLSFVEVLSELETLPGLRTHSYIG